MEAYSETALGPELLGWTAGDRIGTASQIVNASEMGEKSAGRMISTYLSARAEEYRRLCELRRKGWNNPEGDHFFARQRAVADASDPQTARHFFSMMQKIGRELHDATAAFTIAGPQQGHPNFLDLCMAPGGFLSAAMQCNPGASAVAYSLSLEDGGHAILMPTRFGVRTQLLDITMLAADMGVYEIPKQHPDAKKFLPKHFHEGRVYDLVLCDGQVLRNHPRADYREKREARRLTITQLALGLEHMKTGGTMIVLLHKLEAPDTVELLHQFNSFSTMRLFKPPKNHAKRSSFYLVASNIQSEQAEALAAVESWKHVWKVATFGEEADYRKLVSKDSLWTEEMLNDFGLDLIRFGKDIWDIQARALAKAPFIVGL